MLAMRCFDLFLALQMWYQLGKTLAEQAAWKFAEENSMDLITLHPVFVIGPVLQPTLNMSVELILNLVNGMILQPCVTNY